MKLHNYLAVGIAVTLNKRQQEYTATATSGTSFDCSYQCRIAQRHVLRLIVWELLSDRYEQVCKTKTIALVLSAKERANILTGM